MVTQLFNYASLQLTSYRTSDYELRAILPNTKKLRIVSLFAASL